MKKRIARLLATATLLGALTGVVGSGGSASALQCQPVNAVTVCTDASQGGNWAAVYSDFVQVESVVGYGSENATGVILGEGFSSQSSGVVLYCNTMQRRYHLLTIVNGSATDRKLNQKCK